MPTLPLYVPPEQQAFADGWHAVAAPGGYEWWHFDAEDPATDTRLVAVFYEGCPFHPGYLRAYARYRRNPTRVAPPLPRDSVCIHVAVYRGGQTRYQSLVQYDAADFAAATDRLDVRIGPSRCRTEADRTVRLTLKDTASDGRTLSAELAFTPRLSHPPVERPLLDRAVTGSDHYWVLANPLCDVAGTVEVSGRGSAADRVELSGSGYHDHQYGSGPIALGVRRWLWGRVLAGGRASAFHLVVPRDGARDAGFHLLERDERGLRDVGRDRAPFTAWDRRTTAGLTYPGTLDLGGGLVLRDPRVVGATPFQLRLTYETQSLGEPGRAFCEVVHPGRLRWPVLGRRIERSIERRPRAP
jgi:carotenoid 1,2-hydratase